MSGRGSDASNKQIPAVAARVHRAVAIISKTPVLPAVLWLSDWAARAGWPQHYRRGRMPD